MFPNLGEAGWIAGATAVIVALLGYLLIRPHSDRPERRALAKIARETNELADGTVVLLLGTAAGGQQLWAIMPARVRRGCRWSRAGHRVLATDAGRLPGTTFVHAMATDMDKALVVGHLIDPGPAVEEEDYWPLPCLGRELGSFPTSGADVPARLQATLRATMAEESA